VLARELAVRGSVEDAIASYDAQRRPATNDVVLANREGGPDQCLEIVERRAPDGFVDVEAVIGRDELEAIASRYGRTAGRPSARCGAPASWPRAGAS